MELQAIQLLIVPYGIETFINGLGVIETASF